MVFDQEPPHPSGQKLHPNAGIYIHIWWNTRIYTESVYILMCSNIDLDSPLRIFTKTYLIDTGVGEV
jgi:hypothetical protein